MSHIIVDKTQGSKNKSSANRDKFMKRASDRVKDAVKDYIANDADIKSISDGKQKRIKVPPKTLKEPTISNDHENNEKRNVVIGNTDFERGDKIAKPPRGSGGRGGAGPGEEGEDEFYFTISHDEFVEMFFDGLELPDLVKKQLREEMEFETRPAGYTTEGPPCRLDLRKTMVNSIKRNFAISGEIDAEIEKLEAELKLTILASRIVEIKSEIEELENQRDSIPFIQELDLRYRKNEQYPIPYTKAVMISCMDVSGSMTEYHKELSKRFFMILYMFLTKQYESVDLVFIKHHHEAKEVDEHDFFYSRESGGTVVSTALDLASKIIKERYDPSLYNIYMCQMSDGDDWETGGEYDEIFRGMNELLSMVQYYAYVEVADEEQPSSGLSGFGSMRNREESTLMKFYKAVKQTVSSDRSGRFSIRNLKHRDDVYKVFRSLFEKDVKNEQA